MSEAWEWRDTNSRMPGTGNSGRTSFKNESGYDLVLMVMGEWAPQSRDLNWHQETERTQQDC